MSITLKQLYTSIFFSLLVLGVFVQVQTTALGHGETDIMDINPMDVCDDSSDKSSHTKTPDQYLSLRLSQQTILNANGDYNLDFYYLGQIITNYAVIKEASLSNNTLEIVRRIARELRYSILNNAP